jgi:phosphomannomutase
MIPIRFGTDGWRAVIADDFTFARVACVAQAIAEYLRGLAPSPTVAVGYDTRFLSERSAGGVQVHLTQSAVPSPVIAWIVRKRGWQAGIMITASHNPPQWNGIKIKMGDGTPAPPAVTTAVEARANEFLAGAMPTVGETGAVQPLDVTDEYLVHIKSLVNVDAVRDARIRVLADTMHGAGMGYLDRTLEEVGCVVTRTRTDYNPGFERIPPEPVGRHLEASIALTRDSEIDVGFATDGDADRLGVMADGEYLDAQRMFALLLRHLVRNRGGKGAVIKTVSTTSMLDRLAVKYGLPLVITPVGFKYIGEMMLQENALIGGEESGGVAVQGHIPERDGTFAALLFAEMMAMERKSVAELLEDLWNDVGGAHYYRRTDLPVPPEARERVRDGLGAVAPKMLGSHHVASVDHRDGVKIFTDDGSWLLMRASGTEPLVRAYVESQDEAAIPGLITAGEEILRALAK